MNSIAFFDLETSYKNHQIFDIGCIKSEGATFHENAVQKFLASTQGTEFACGHIIIRHDIKYIRQAAQYSTFGENNTFDTLYLSPFIILEKPYRRLVKDDKLQVKELTTSLNAFIRAGELFNGEIVAYFELHVHSRTNLIIKLIAGWISIILAACNQINRTTFNLIKRNGSKTYNL